MAPSAETKRHGGTLFGAICLKHAVARIPP